MGATKHTMNQAALFTGWGTPAERERRRRIRLCLYAFAYEVETTPMVDDATFDALALLSRPEVTTGRFDAWWRETFSPHTGQWIHNHPDLAGIARLYARRTKTDTDQGWQDTSQL